jgi:hypothetical protein
MDKLVSLKEKPATEKDLYKTIYSFYGTEAKMLDIRTDRWAMDIEDSIGIRNIRVDDPDYYWSKPVIIAESEYKQLTAKLDTSEKASALLAQTIKAQYDDSLALKAKLEEAKGLMERANEIIYDDIFHIESGKRNARVNKQWLSDYKDYRKVEK